MTSSTKGPRRLQQPGTSHRTIGERPSGLDGSRSRPAGRSGRPRSVGSSPKPTRPSPTSPDGILHTVRGRLGILVLPDAHDRTARLLQPSIGVTVPSDVADELVVPPGPVGPQGRRVLGTAMPEAPISVWADSRCQSVVNGRNEGVPAPSPHEWPLSHRLQVSRGSRGGGWGIRTPEAPKRQHGFQPCAIGLTRRTLRAVAPSTGRRASRSVCGRRAVRQRCSPRADPTDCAVGACRSSAATA